jgi:hypothetical protein
MLFRKYRTAVCDLYELYAWENKKEQLKKNWSDENSLKMIAEPGEVARLQEARIFRLFYRTSLFFITIRLPIYWGGGSAPHFAANATLKYQHAR